MNPTAEQHLARAKEYIAKGDQYYRSAKPEIESAHAAGATIVEISRYLERGKSWVSDVLRWDGIGTLYGNDTERRRVDQAKQVLREADPETVAERILNDPAIRANVVRAQEVANDSIEQKSREAERAALGDDLSDRLHTQQTLREAEGEMFKARRALIQTLRLINEYGGELDDSWREQFLATVDDLEGKVGLLRSLLSGNLDVELEALLGGES